jgi:adenylate cyclase
MAKLIVTTADGNTQTFGLEERNTLGRHPEQSVQVLDRVVSKQHAEVLYYEDRYWLRDLGSRNGTFINGHRIDDPRALVDGDQIGMGSTRITYRESDDNTHSELDRSLQTSVDMITADPPATTTDTAIRSRVQADALQRREFLAESEIIDEFVLREDYEKLRIVFELNRSIGSETTQEIILQRILEKAFEYTNADRGVILLLNADGTPIPSAFKSRRDNDERMELSQTILNEVLNHHNAVLSSDATMDSRFGGSQSIIMQGIRSTMCVPLKANDDLLGMIHVDTRLAIGVFTEKDLQILTVFANQAALRIANARYGKQAEEEAIVRNSLSRLLSPNLVEEIVKGSITMDKRGELREATVLFADIRRFTQLTENLEAQNLLSLLNEYFELMVDIIFRYEGTLDKFIGDEIMAVWGTPVRQEDHVKRAVQAAIEMRAALAEFNTKHNLPDRPILEVGYGINTGSVVAGYMGSRRTHSYTVIGDSVNIASRLCGKASPGQILVGDPVIDKLRESLVYETLDRVQLKGKTNKVQVYSVTDLKPGN